MLKKSIRSMYLAIPFMVAILIFPSNEGSAQWNLTVGCCPWSISITGDSFATYRPTDTTTIGTPIYDQQGGIPIQVGCILIQVSKADIPKIMTSKNFSGSSIVLKESFSLTDKMKKELGPRAPSQIKAGRYSVTKDAKTGNILIHFSSRIPLPTSTMKPLPTITKEPR